MWALSLLLFTITVCLPYQAPLTSLQTRPDFPLLINRLLNLNIIEIARAIDSRCILALVLDVAHLVAIGQVVHIGSVATCAGIGEQTREDTRDERLEGW